MPGFIFSKLHNVSPVRQNKEAVGPVDVRKTPHRFHWFLILTATLQNNLCSSGCVQSCVQTSSSGDMAV